MCFRQQLDVVLAKCTCWDTAVGTEGPFCKDRGAPRSRVGKKVAASAAATAADDHRDPSAVAEAAKKADDAMDALVREEAGRQSAVAAKATKKTRKRATKAAASRNAAQLTATNDAGRSAAPALVNSSLHAASCADGSGVCEAEQPRAKTAEITRGGLPGARQTGVPQWVMCPISQGIFRDPVVCTDGLSYERAAVEDWLVEHDTSFVTHERLSSKDVVPNRALKSRLQDLGMIA